MVTFSRIPKGPKPWPSQKHDDFPEHLVDVDLPYEAVANIARLQRIAPLTFRNVRVAALQAGSSSTGNLEPKQSSIAAVYADATSRNPHIAVTPNVLDGKPCVKGTRTPVALVLRYLAVDDDPMEDLDITKKDVADCLKFAATVCDQPLRHGE